MLTTAQSKEISKYREGLRHLAYSYSWRLSLYRQIIEECAEGNLTRIYLETSGNIGARFRSDRVRDAFFMKQMCDAVVSATLRTMRDTHKQAVEAIANYGDDHDMAGDVYDEFFSTSRDFIKNFEMKLNT